MVISKATPSMTEAFVELTNIMGYKNTSEEMHQRLTMLCSNPQHRLLVAQEQDRIIGFCHGYVRTLTEIPTDVEIGGLSVIEEYQGKGVGTALLQSIEEWAKKQHISTLMLSSNSMRTHAHAFYEHKGFKKIKQQFVFKKSI